MIHTDWICVDYLCSTNKENYIVIDFIQNKINTEKKYLGNVHSFINNIINSYHNDSAMIKQALIDIPREQCFVNGILTRNYNQFINEIGCTPFKKELIALSTQASMYPIFADLLSSYPNEKFKDGKFKDEESYALVDFQKDNPVIMYYWIENDFVTFEIKKKFRIISLKENLDPLQILQIYAYIEFGKDNKEVYYYVTSSNE